MYLPKSPELSLPTQIISSYKLWEEVLYVVKLIENCRSEIYLQHLIFLLLDHIWSHLPDFGRPEQGQNCPAANFELFFSLTSVSALKRTLIASLTRYTSNFHG